MDEDLLYAIPFVGLIALIAQLAFLYQKKRGRKVVITSRGSENHAVLVGEAYLNELEAAAKRLRDIESGKAKPASDFKLIGSGRIADGVDDPLADIRRDANTLWEKKLASFGK